MLNKFGLLGGSIAVGKIFLSGKKNDDEKKDDVPDKWDIMFKNASIEGKKYGVEKAAKEYEKPYRELQQNYSETKIAIETELKAKNENFEQLYNKIEELEQAKNNLETKLRNKINSCTGMSSGSAQSVTSVMMENSYSSISYGTLSTCMEPRFDFDITDLIYNIKLNNWRKAALEGYEEVKKKYEEKINVLKSDLEELKRRAKQEFEAFNLLNSEMLEAITHLLEEIAQLKMKIAQLAIMQNEDYYA